MKSRFILKKLNNSEMGFQGELCKLGAGSDLVFPSIWIEFSVRFPIKWVLTLRELLEDFSEKVVEFFLDT